MISRRLILALVAVATTPPLLAWAFRSDPKPPAPPTITERLAQVDADLPAAKKEDRLPETRIVRTIPITQPPKVAEPVREVQPPAAAIAAGAAERLRETKLTPPPEAEEDPPRRRKVRAKRERHAGDVCSRHGQRKVMVGKYRWRCRR